MTVFQIALLSVAEKSAHMAQVDPHGWTITLIAVSVVFLALLVLYAAYSLIGALCNPKQIAKRFVRKLQLRLEQRKKEAGDDASDSEVAVAIAVALQMYEKENAHDEESYILTIKRK